MTWEAYPNEWLTTLTQLKNHMVGSGNVTTWNDTTLTWCIEQASAGIIRNLQRLPLPYTATLKIDYSKRYIDRNSMVINLFKDTELLAVTSITNGDNSSVAASKYYLEPANSYPKHRIAMKESSGLRWRENTSNNEWRQAITIVGIFGYVPHYSNAWPDSGADINEGGQLSASDTTLTVTDGTVFSVGDYIKIDNEILFISAISTNDLTVKRGKLGTSAATHEDSTDIYIFEQKHDLELSATEWAAYLYKTKDKIGDEIITFANGVQAPRGLSPMVVSAVGKNRKVTFGGFSEY